GETPPELSIPEGLRDVIGKRLSRLSPECNRLLTVAAVIGREFRLDVLQRVSRVTEDEAVSALEEGLKVGVLEERAAVGDVIYRFSHAFFRQTLYEELSAARRIRLHQEVGRARWRRSMLVGWTTMPRSLRSISRTPQTRLISLRRSITESWGRARPWRSSRMVKRCACSNGPLKCRRSWIRMTGRGGAIFCCSWARRLWLPASRSG